jgi:uncharacterized protein (TIGR03435 family)
MRTFLLSLTQGVLVTVAFVSPALVAQEPRFEVASVRVNTEPPDADNSSGPLGPTPTGFVADNAELLSLITYAWDIPLQHTRLRVGASRDVMSRRFVINAKGDGDRRAMLRTLLAERFGMKVHTETRLVPSLVLRVKAPGKLGRNLKPAAFDCQEIRRARLERAKWPEACVRTQESSNGVRTLRNAGPINALVLTLQSSLRPPIVNETGLTGNYEWTLAILTKGDVSLNTMDAVEDQLGLNLERATRPLEVLVIDGIKMPSPN